MKSAAIFAVAAVLIAAWGLASTQSETAVIPASSPPAVGGDSGANASLSPMLIANSTTQPADSGCGSDAACHAKILSGQMEALVQHLRSDAKVVSDPRAKAMFETSAEAILGLKKAMDDYQTNNEPAWAEK